MEDCFIVITTINAKTKAIEEFEKQSDWHIVVVGDRKSQPIESTERLTFLSIEDQRQLGYRLVDRCPYDHYTRKNIGYLYAIAQGARVIYDTDDDNLPYEGRWELPTFLCERQLVTSDEYWNAYQYFTDEYIWPRGYPLRHVGRSADYDLYEEGSHSVGVWQGLADLDPDVDAIFRLIFGQPITFQRRPPVVLPTGVYCPFNSQNTFWRKEAFPFLFLPATVSFRFTDILRGYVAQRLMWTQGLHLGFTEATVYQERNEHDLMRDFADEVECYLHVEDVVETLEALGEERSPAKHLLAAYEALHREGYVRAEELSLCSAWIEDYESIIANQTSI